VRPQERRSDDRAEDLDVALSRIRPDRTSRGAGGATTVPTPAAIANAVFAACGARLRATPFTPARLRAALFGG
jgi:nicotinate dehydrogenase subunit B